MWKKTLKWFIHDFKKFAKDEEVSKINKPVVVMANNFNLNQGEEDIEELLEDVPEKLINEELQKLKQKSTAEDEAREKETAEKEKEENPSKFIVKHLAETFTDFKLFKKFENMDPNTKNFYQSRRMFIVHYLLTSNV